MDQFPEDRPVESLESALRRRICSVCIDQSVNGSCFAREEEQCALFAHFPKVAQCISGVHSDKMDDYVAAIRQSVCAECANQDIGGVCRVRDEVRCALDRYLRLIVEVIEETRGITLVRSEG